MLLDRHRNNFRLSVRLPKGRDNTKFQESGHRNEGSVVRFGISSKCLVQRFVSKESHRKQSFHRRLSFRKFATGTGTHLDGFHKEEGHADSGCYEQLNKYNKKNFLYEASTDVCIPFRFCCSPCMNRAFCG